jgi:hypothetical protein
MVAAQNGVHADACGVGEAGTLDGNKFKVINGHIAMH